MQVEASEGSAGYPGWRVLFAAVFGLAFSPGPLIFGSLGLFAPHLHEAFGWGRGDIMLTLTLLNVGGLVAAPFTGRLIDRFGARTVLIPSVILFAAGFAAMAVAVTSLTSLYVVAFVWGLVTVGAQSITYAQLLTRWFSRRRGLAIGIAAAGLGVGYTVTPLIVSALLEHLDWRGALLALGGLVVFGPLVVNILLARAPKVGATVGATAELPGLSLAEARRTSSFRLIVSAIGMMSAVLTGIVPHIVLIAGENGFAGPKAAWIASLYGASTVLGRVVVGALTDRFAPARVAMTFFSIAAVGFGLLAIAAGVHMPALLIVATVAIGLGFGAESDLIAIFIARYFGQKAFGAIYGWLLSAFILGAAVGPAVLGYGRDALGGYTGLMACAAVVSGIAVALLFRLDPRPKTAWSALNSH